MIFSEFNDIQIFYSTSHSSGDIERTKTIFDCRRVVLSYSQPRSKARNADFRDVMAPPTARRVLLPLQNAAGYDWDLHHDLCKATYTRRIPSSA